MAESNVVNDESDQGPETEAGEAFQRDTSLNIWQRMHAIRADVRSYIAKDRTQEVRKDGRKVGQFDYVSHDDVIAHSRAAFIKHGVHVNPSATDMRQDGNRTVMWVDVAFVNIDEPADQFVMKMPAYGMDFSDKGPGKALTYAVKSALLKQLQLQSADDIEADDIEHEPEARTEEVERAEQKADDALMTAANAIRDRLKAITSIEGIDEYMADLDTQRTLKRLTPVARDFLKNLAERIKTEMEQEG